MFYRIWLFVAVLAHVLAIMVTGQGPSAANPSVQPFRLDQVQLGNGLLQEKRDRIKSFLREYDERCFLVLFNNQAGRPNPSGVSPPGGWEDGGLLSGHWTGHFMTALSQAYAELKEDIFKRKLDWMVKELAACQNAYTASKAPTHPGYLGALPEDTILRAGPPRFALYGTNNTTNTWAPWYTQHKIVRGLLDAYYNTNNSEALRVAVKMAEWAHLALTIGDKNQPGYSGNITRDDLNYMWDTYIAGEFGGANEVYAEIYALTSDSKHLETARAFDNRESLFGASVANQDILVVTPERKPGRRRALRLHANTHVPQFLGYMRVYEKSGESEYFTSAKNFFNWIVPHREFASGGMSGTYPGSDGNAELFQNRGNIANAIGSNGAETCTTYNTLKLARNLFLHEQNAMYMDHYERGLLNMIAGSRADTNSVKDPQLTYFQPLSPGTSREFGNTGTCCGGTGMESHTKYQETVYFRSADRSALWVNLYVPSTLDWSEKGFSVKQETKFPRGDTTRFTIMGEGQLEIKLRVPKWISKGFYITINGQSQPIKDPQPSTYISLDRVWKTGDTIEVRMPFSIRIERALDRPDTQSILWGPIVLQIIGTPNSNSKFWELSLYKSLKLDGDYSRAAIVRSSKTTSGDPLFTITNKTTNKTMDARPYYISDSLPVSTYFRRVEPVVVFGSVDTGVPNRKRNDHLPNYDVPVSGITSPGTDGPSFLDLVWDKAPFATHGDFMSVVTSVLDAFVAAGVYNAKERDLVLGGARRAEKELTT